jgi:ATP-dependent protease ClpP protease subunit
MIHQASGSVGGTLENVRATLAFQSELESETDELLAQATTRTGEEIRIASRVDNWMNASGSIEFGLVDHILAAAPHIA